MTWAVVVKVVGVWFLVSVLFAALWSLLGQFRPADRGGHTCP
jgi:hypothetical protein